jgi:hypothetical protein
MAVYGVDPQTGETVEVDSEASLAALGYAPAGDAEIKQAQLDEARREKFSTTGQQVATAVEKAASALTFGGSTIVERGLLGINPEDIRAREEINPIAAGLGTAAGIVAPLALTGGAAAAPTLGKATVGAGVRAAARMTAPATIARLGRTAAGAAERLLPVTAESGIARQLAARAIKTGVGSAVEGAAYGLGEVVNEAALGDPNLTAQSALATIGLSATLAGGLGVVGGLAEAGVPAALKKGRDAIQDLYRTGKKGIQNVYGSAERLTGTPRPIVDLIFENGPKIREMSKEAGTDFGAILTDARTKPEMARHILDNQSRYVELEQLFPGTTRQLAPTSPEMASKMLDNFQKIITDPSVRMRIAKEAAAQTSGVIRATDDVIRSANIALRKNAGSLFKDLRSVDNPKNFIAPTRPYYHASTDKEIELMNDYTTFLTPSRDAAKGYLGGKPGRIYRIEVPDSAKIADETILIDTAKKLGKKTQYPYQLVDDLDVQAELESQGYHGVSFRDVGPDNKYEHQTIALWKAEDAGAYIANESTPAAPAMVPALGNKHALVADPVAIRTSYRSLISDLDDIVVKMRSQPELYDQWHAKFAERLREGLERDANKMVGTAFTPDVAFLRLKTLRTQIGNETKWKSFHVENMSQAERSSNQLFQNFYHKVKNVIQDPSVFGKAASIQSGLDDLQTAWKAAKGRESGFRVAFLDRKGNVKATKVNTWFNQMADLRGEEKSAAWGEMMSASRKSLDAIENLNRQIPVKGFDRGAFSDLLDKTATQTEEAGSRAAATQIMHQLRPSPSFGSYGSYAVTPGEQVAKQMATGPIAWVKSAINVASSIKHVDKTVAALTFLERSAQRVNGIVEKGVSRILSSRPAVAAERIARSAAAAGIAGYVGGEREASNARYAKRAEEVRRLAGDPEALHRTLVTATEAFDEHAPNTTQSVTIASTRALTFLASKLPQPPANRGLWGQKWTPSPAEIAKFNRYYRAANRPLTILKDAARGTLTSEAVEAVSTIYPELMDQIRAAALAKAASHTRPPPYRGRMALAMLLGQDIDGTLSPASIQAAQASHAAPSSKSPENQTGTAAPVKPSSTGLAKVSLSSRTLTPMQKSAQRD